MKRNNYIASTLMFFLIASIGIPAINSLWAAKYFAEYTIGLFVLVFFLVWAIYIGIEGVE